ncbi:MULTISPECIES: hypothetical protein [unclassified Halomonas]|nr:MULTISPECIES: hypothetical protein [unclassified Halomonas]MBT2787343.1 hypothetical protein [Halomonas sp. ISL-106]MBT2796295.1 hypothetical protein [Halomonas sp. ISL-104]
MCNKIADNLKKPYVSGFSTTDNQPWRYGKAPAFELEPLDGGDFKLWYA